jgi:hypothetical protein
MIIKGKKKPSPTAAGAIQENNPIGVCKIYAY